MTEEELKTFDFTSVNIADLLPQRKPFVMISSLLSCSYERTVARFLIQEDNVFVEDGRLVPEGLVENIAQLVRPESVSSTNTYSISLSVWAMSARSRISRFKRLRW